MQTERTILEKKPLYAVLFTTAYDPAVYEPLLIGHAGDLSRATLPHGLDREVAEALPGLWYCLHLPSTFYDLIDLSAATMKSSQLLDNDHAIVLAPTQVFDRACLDERPPWLLPTLLLAPDSILEAVAGRSADLGFALRPMGFSQLSDRSLREHWRSIHAHFLPNTPCLRREPTLSRRLDIAPLDLPAQRLAQQMNNRLDPELRIAADVTSLLDESLRQQTVVAAIARLEREGATLEDARKAMHSVVQEEGPRLQLPVVVAAPGVAPAYERKAYGGAVRDRVVPLPAVDEADTWSLDMSQRADHLVERAAIEFVATHRAVARGGVGLMLPSVPREAFVALAELERHFGTARSGRKVWTILDRLDAAVQPLWSEAVTQAVGQAFMLTVFSNFPLGLVRRPGDTAPLACRVPIAYRPLIPLTRTLQFELADNPMVSLTDGIRVLVAECIPSRDPIGLPSRAGWDVAAKVLRESGQSATLDHVETLSVRALREAIRERNPNILVISAHGAFDEGLQAAGLAIGQDVWLGPGLWPLPPVVILSACQVAPRGTGAVSVADMLLREGALAVLGTQVPVDVRRNAMLMVRLFLYMAEVLAGREQHSSLLEIWHRVQTSNAINDILSGSDALWEWGMTTTSGAPRVITEFMNVRSAGRVRLSHVYKDTESVLVEMADERGNGDRVRALLRSPGYVPESAFYVFIGRPERIYLRWPIESAHPRDDG